MTSSSDSNSSLAFAYAWDYVLVFSMIENSSKNYKQTQTSKGIIETLQSRGVRTFTYKSVQGDELYCMVQVDTKSLCHFADKIEFPMELDPDRLEAFFTGKLHSAKGDENASLLDKRTRRSGKRARSCEPVALPSDHPLVEYRLKYGIKERQISDGANLKTEGIDPPSLYSPYDLIFIAYEKEIPQQFYLHTVSIDGNNIREKKKNEWDDKDPTQEPVGKLFSPLQRLKLIYYYLKCSHNDGGCGIQIDKFLNPPIVSTGTDESVGSSLTCEKEILKKPVMCAFYPLHSREISASLIAESTKILITPWIQPFDELRNYFGEKIAIFYVFIGHYTLWLLIPSFFGIIFQLVVVISGDYSHPVLTFFGIIISSWAIIMLQYWKRRQASIAMQWGMLEFEQTEPDRPEFYGVPIKSFINGEDIIFFPELIYVSRIQNSCIVVASFILMVVGVVSSIYVLKFQISAGNDLGGFTADTQAGLVAGMLNAIQIQILNYLYQNVARRMTELENPRTDTLYTDSLIGKIFIFQFINSYSAFFYIAFVAQFMTLPKNANPGDCGQCGGPTCMAPLALNLAIVFGSRLTVANVLDFVLPYYAYHKKRKAETADVPAGTTMSTAEEDYLLMAYDPMMSNIIIYADAAIQFGYCTLFVTALPAAPVFACFSNYVMIKVNTYKMLTFYQRPVPQGAQDMGTWESIFNIIAMVCVVTNAALVSFTMDVLGRSKTTVGTISYLGGLKNNANLSSLACVWVFIGITVFLFFLQYLCDLFIEDEPNEVSLQKERTEFFKQKIIDKISDEDECEAAIIQTLDEIGKKNHRRKSLSRAYQHSQASGTSTSASNIISEAAVVGEDFTPAEVAVLLCQDRVSSKFKCKGKHIESKNPDDLILHTEDYWAYLTANETSHYYKEMDIAKHCSERESHLSPSCLLDGQGVEMRATLNPIRSKDEKGGSNKSSEKERRLKLSISSAAEAAADLGDYYPTQK